MDFAKINAAAENYKDDMVRFLELSSVIQAKAAEKKNISKLSLPKRKN